MVDGECLVQERITPGCESPTDPQVVYDIFDDRCENNNQPVPDAVITCGEELESRGWELQRVDNRWQCVKYSSLGVDPTPTCSIGAFNEESGMCEIKPGNRRGA